MAAGCLLYGKVLKHAAIQWCLAWSCHT